jgi:Flp pilus assembly pilin Flp
MGQAQDYGRLRRGESRQLSDGRQTNEHQEPPALTPLPVDRSQRLQDEAHVDSWKEVKRVFDFIRTYVQRMRDRDEEGQALVEYALIVSLVSIAAVAALGIVGGDISNILQSVATHL